MINFTRIQTGAKQRQEKRTNYQEMFCGQGEKRVMFRWRCSLWRLLWRELMAYTITFLLISMVYRYTLTQEHQMQLEKLIRWCRLQSSGLPITFLLGFYVSLVVKRWWEQYCKLPWPDTIAIYLKGLVVGKTQETKETARMVRRTVIRYCMLAYILCIRQLSVRLMKRFPTMDDLVNTGIVYTDEVMRIGEEGSANIFDSNWWIPIKWAIEIMNNAQKEGLVQNAPGYSHMMGRLSEFRSALAEVATYVYLPVPLVYTQVVHLAVYVYFAVSLIGEQWIIWRRPGDEEVDLYYPIFMTVRFLFIFGWLRVAETLYNPFGEDDEDFELNELLNRHFKVAMGLVDETEDPPELKKDIFWNQPEPELVEQAELVEAHVNDQLESQEQKLMFVSTL